MQRSADPCLLAHRVELFPRDTPQGRELTRRGVRLELRPWTWCLIRPLVCVALSCETATVLGRPDRGVADQCDRFPWSQHLRLERQSWASTFRPNRSVRRGQFAAPLGHEAITFRELVPHRH